MRTLPSAAVVERTRQSCKKQGVTLALGDELAVARLGRALFAKADGGASPSAAPSRKAHA